MVMSNGSISQAAPARPPVVEAEKGKAHEAHGAHGASVEATARKQLNVQILQSSMELTIQTGDKSLELLFRAAIDKINAFLEPELGPDAIQNAAGQDNSPEGTAERILFLSLGFFDAYAGQYPDKDPARLAEDFVALIRGGFERGFGEAVDILKSLEVFSGTIETEVMKTYELVHKGLDDFLASKLPPPADKNPATAV
jgi:hypothetical protein